LLSADPLDARAVAAEAAAASGRRLWALDAALLPEEPEAVAELAVLWARQLRLLHAALFVVCPDGEPDPARVAFLARFLAHLSGPLLVVGTVPELPARPLLRLELQPPSAVEQCRLWVEALALTQTEQVGLTRTAGASARRKASAPSADASTSAPLAAAHNDLADRLAAQFQLTPARIRAAVAEADTTVALGEPLETRLWRAARAQARPRLDGLARRVEPAVTWNDLVLPEEAVTTLRATVAAARGQATAYTHWGFAARNGRGLGLSALFAGPSGTGKTSAAEIVAGELELDLYQIDVSQVVSKYVGETEKQLRRIFDAAERGACVLLFDEADALFGKRGEVKDSHDRFANLEVSYLLQRIERYRGLAILTTNMKQALDSAFLRRIRFVVNFPFPGVAQREAIWRRAFPPTAPTQGLDYAKLARLNLAGGNLRGIALNAACLAAAEGRPIGMEQLRRAARVELAKLERSAETELADWI
jgi:ATP-dependent 26S proteasome regulatory subunit